MHNVRVSQNSVSYQAIKENKTIYMLKTYIRPRAGEHGNHFKSSTTQYNCTDGLVKTLLLDDGKSFKTSRNVYSFVENSAKLCFETMKLPSIINDGLLLISWTCLHVRMDESIVKFK